MILHHDQESGEESEVLFMMGRHIGRLRLLGISDPYADAMDKQLQELVYEDKWLRKNLRVLNSSVPRCVCSYCKR